METDKQSTYLANKLDEQIKVFDRYRENNKFKALFFKLSITALGGITTVIWGLQGVGNEDLFRNVALVLSATITLLGTFDTFFDHRAMWVRYTKTVTDLRAIRSDLEYQQTVSDNLASEKLDRLYARYKSVITDTNEWWHQLREKETEKDSVHQNGLS